MHCSHPQADLVVKIAELVEAKILTGVADVRDESDRQGVRVVVEVGFLGSGMGLMGWGTSDTK